MKVGNAHRIQKPGRLFTEEGRQVYLASVAIFLPDNFGERNVHAGVSHNLAWANWQCGHGCGMIQVENKYMNADMPPFSRQNT